jgi:hypothetical protein
MDDADVVFVAFLVCLTVGGLLAESREALGPTPCPMDTIMGSVPLASGGDGAVTRRER